MKRKMIGIGMGLLTLALLGGCNSSKESDMISQIEEKPEVTEAPTAGESIKKENPEYNIQTRNLTEQNQMEICIDYSITGYNALQEFGYKLFAQNMEEENPVLSPTSAYLALALAGAGAAGDTREEFVEVLGDLECIPSDLMLNLPREKEGMTISLANSAWVDDRMIPKEEWLAWADCVYQSEVFQTKLSTETAMKDMNTWIDKQTKGLISELLKQPLDEDARLALFNTIYFKGDWRKEFSGDHTRELDFTLADGSVEQVEMMQMLNEELRYVKNDLAEGVILPYSDDSMAFVALKPFENMTVREMYEQLSVTDISDFLQKQGTTLCNLRLPKFEVEFDRKLNDSLKNMGLELAFIDGVADFSDLGSTDTGEGVYINLVHQKAKVIVDETGTEAAAVTTVIMNKCTAVMDPQMPIDIYFDEPFLYMIMDTEREIPLFIGIMDAPNK